MIYNKVLKSKEFGSYASYIKKTTIISQITAVSVTLQRGHVSPMRLMWWQEYLNRPQQEQQPPIQVNTLSAAPRFNQDSPV